MHSLLPYSMRCFNPALPGNPKDKYAILDKIGQFDAYTLLKTYIESKTNEFHIVEDAKQVFRFNSMVFDTDKRLIYGWLQAGYYGKKTDIINISTGQVDFEKALHNAEIINHFIYFFLPKGLNKGISLLHAHRGNGIKTLFFELFNEYFKNKTTLHLQMNALSYEKALNGWMDGNAKEIRLIKFAGWADSSDTLLRLGSNEQDLILKAPRKGALGKFKDYYNNASDQAKAVEALSSLCAQVKTVIELDGKKRIFTVGCSDSSTMYAIDAPEELTLVDGNPEFNAIKQWCEEISIEFFNEIYPNMVMYPACEVS
jgi:hypothetical protein